MSPTLYQNLEVFMQFISYNIFVDSFNGDKSFCVLLYGRFRSENKADDIEFGCGLQRKRCLQLTTKFTRPSIQSLDCFSN